MAKINRRKFLESTAAAGAFTIVPRSVLGGSGYVAPSDKLTLAHIGMGTQSIREIGGLLEEPRIQIVAVCDPNTDSSDYVEWSKNEIRRRIQSYLGNTAWRENSKGCPGGRLVGQEIVNTYYANQRSEEKFNGCAVYADFRELLEKEKDIDAVKIMTPDHLHSFIAIAAMKKGMHVLMHKPIANRMHEGRRVLQVVKETKTVTHLLAHGSGRDNGRIIEEINKGVIGPLREIHNWTNRPVWPQYVHIPTETPPVPEGFDWDLWLGPAQFRPYHPCYTHTVYRGWYEFGGGCMADMGIYSLWPVFTGLNLKCAQSAEAWSTHHYTVIDHVSTEIENDFSYPTACAIRFHFVAGEQRPDLDLFWYDGGMKPRLGKEIEAYNVEMRREGILYVGDEGAIFADFNGGSPRLLAKGVDKPLWEETESREERRRRNTLWLDAMLSGEQSPGSFLNTAAITDTVNLGTVALRAGRKVIFDSETMSITNNADANKFLYRDCHPGWEL